jgi:hypothetical protein
VRFKTLVAVIAVAFMALVAPTAANAASAQGALSHSSSSVAKHRCTHTSSGTCIRGGQFCPKAKYGQSGWDAYNRRYVCKGNHTHPHWMKP